MYFAIEEITVTPYYIRVGRSIWEENKKGCDWVRKQTIKVQETEYKMDTDSGSLRKRVWVVSKSMREE